MKTSIVNLKRYRLLSIKKLSLYLVLAFMVSCYDNSNLKEAISPCEDEFKNDLVPLKQITTSDFINSNLWYGSRTSDKYLVTSGRLNDSYKYIVVNHQAQTINFFERPYVSGFFLSDSRLYQIQDDHLYLARLDRNAGWTMEAIHLETMDSEVIPIMLGNENPKEILQVEKHENDIYILAAFEQSNAIFTYSISEKTLKLLYNPSDAFYTTGFKVMRYDPNNNYILRAAIDSSNFKTIIEGVNTNSQQPFYSNTYNGLLMNHNYPYHKEMLPFDSNDRLYLNFIDSKSTIIEAKTGRTISNSDKHIIPFSSDYALSYYRLGDNIDSKAFDIINPVTGEILIDANWETKFFKSELLNPTHLLIDTYYECDILNLETKCVEHKKSGEFYKTKENEFIIIDGEGIYFYKI